MKRFDDSTKKLIKNIAALLTSALVLVAATIAWFTSSRGASVGALTTGLQSSQFTIDYYHPEKDDYILANATRGSGVGSLAAFTFWSDEDGTAASSFSPLPCHEDDPSTANVNEDKWGTLYDGRTAIDWTIPSLFPGEYDVFIMDVRQVSSARAQLVISGITVTSQNGAALTADQVETVLKNVYLYAVAYTKTVTTDETTGETTTTFSANPVGKVCDSFFNLKRSNKIVALTEVDSPASYGADVTVVFYIGVPGESVLKETTTTDPETGDPVTSSTLDDDLYDAHAALQKIGAKVHFDSVSIQ